MAPIKIIGTVTIPLRLGSYADTVEEFVVPEVLESVDMVLGKQRQYQNQQSSTVADRTSC
jgi:hypothetical protein